MFTLSTYIELPMSHRLPQAYTGLCVGNVSRDGTTVFPPECPGLVHGHNWIITWDISVESTDEDFMVADFKKIKKLIHAEMDKYDHAMILKKGDPLIKFYRKMYNENGIDLETTRLYEWDQAPTAEYMAYTWYHRFWNIFKEAGIDLRKLVITVEETAHNKVMYTE